MDVLVTYDISTVTAEGARRLHQVAQTCEQYGVRVQYSVFECRLSHAALERLVVALEDVIDSQQDSVFVYRFDGWIADACRALGRPRAREHEDPWIL